jgi:CBS domain-containing protein
MRAGELMTTRVVTVRPEANRHEIAKALLGAGISALPVVDVAGVPLGMVSEGDLIGRAEPERKQRRDWWLALLAEGETLNEDYLANVAGKGEATARDLMSAPLVTVQEDTEASEIASLLARYRIKRVPVLREGRIVGIVSRADLLRAISPLAAPPRPYEEPPPLPEPALGPPPTQPKGDGFSAEDFRHLAEEHRHLRQLEQAEARRQQRLERRAKVRELISQHLAEEYWRSLLHQAHAAADRGEKEFLLLRFPNELCSDNGRAINALEADWPATLRGEAAEVYLRWKQDLKPRGFNLAARIMEFPGGLPGDIGLFLEWGG